MKFALIAASVAGAAILVGGSGSAPALAQDVAPPPAAPAAAAPGRPPMSADMRAQMQAMRAACADDAARLCPEVKTREERRACMMQNHDKVSDTCKTAMADMRQKMRALRAGGPD